MYEGGYPWGWKTSSGYVWPVRGGQHGSRDPAYPANMWKTGQTTSYYPADDGDLECGVAWPVSEPYRFSDHGDGTVIDNLTGLMWLKDADCVGTLDFDSTYDTIDNLNAHAAGYGCTEYTADYHDWAAGEQNGAFKPDRPIAANASPSGRPSFSEYIHGRIPVIQHLCRCNQHGMEC